jgi:hypothetical protein
MNVHLKENFTKTLDNLQGIDSDILKVLVIFSILKFLPISSITFW